MALAVAVLFTFAPPTVAKVHTFKALGGHGRSAERFRVVGLHPDTVVRARLVTKHRGRSAKRRVRRFSVAKVRRAAGSRRHIVFAKGSASSSQMLKVTSAPETTITDGPAGGSETTATNAVFTFSSSAKGSKFYCSLDGSTAARCSSGVTYAALGVGGHNFSVYAVDRSRTADPTPAVRSWKVVPPPSPAEQSLPAEGPPSADQSAPETAIVSGPGQGSASALTVASLWFSGTDDVGVAGY
ncbi:MAG TPA: hypothetical protein VFZ25_10495, partial [Chloroflexota bacterium]|nr:hypothetical protein [Chloroflexota bacterium]